MRGTDSEAYETGIVMARGTILNSKCSCPAHRLYETHCKHVAALAIWLVERGSLLRSGAGGHDYGIAESGSITRDEAKPLVVINQERAKRDQRLRKLIQAHPILLESSFTLTRSQNAAFIEGKDMDGRRYSVPITLIEAAALTSFMLASRKSGPPSKRRGLRPNQSTTCAACSRAARFRR